MGPEFTLLYCSGMNEQQLFKFYQDLGALEVDPIMMDVFNNMEFYRNNRQ